MRKLATVERVTAVTPIPGADFIEAVSVKGWTCVAKKGEFRVGDLGVYHEIDAVPPDSPVYRFLWAPKEARPADFRLQTRRFKKVLSQGLMLPLTTVAITADGLREGQDLTDVLKITKWDPPEVEDSSGPPVPNAPRTIGNWPGLAPKTEEERVQNVNLSKFEGRPYVITRKLDGTSATYGWGKRSRLSETIRSAQRSRYAIVRQMARVLKLIDPLLKPVGQFYTCSRNLAVGPDTTYGKIAKDLNIAERLMSTGQSHLVVQGEIVGPKIQGNPRGLTGPEFYVFNVYDQVQQCYLAPMDARLAAWSLSLEFVPVLEVGESFQYDREALLSKAEGVCPGTSNEEEGIVVNFPDAAEGKVSFKVISNRFLLKKAG